MNMHNVTLPKDRFVDDYLLYLLARASHAISAEFHEQLRRKGVAVAEWRVLACLWGSEGETVTALANACLLQQPTMTKLLDRMVRQNLVQRSPDPQDRRVVRIRLTPRGESTAAGLVEMAKLHEAEVLARLTQVEGEPLKGLLRRFILRHMRGRRSGGVTVMVRPASVGQGQEVGRPGE